ncbi:MAG: LCP family protein [Chloroflexota bacterium]
MKARLCCLLTFLALLTACNLPSGMAESAPQPQFIVVTRVPNPTATPTPFRPGQVSQASPTLGPVTVFEGPSADGSFPSPTLTPFPAVTIGPSPTATLNLPTPDGTLSLLPENWTPPDIYAPAGAPTAFPLMTDTDTVTFLLLGSDLRPGSSFRTDTIVVAALRPKSGQISLLSIPRDFWVYIPEWGMNKVNTAYQHGELYNYPGKGPGLLKDTILYNLGIRIDHVAMVDFDGFRRVVDTLGGVDVPVACAYTDWRLIDPALNPNNEANWHLYTAGPGLVHMDGDLALWYARSRMRSSDFDRGRRQQEVLRALFDQILRGDTLAKVPALYDDITSTVATDLSLKDMIQLAWLAPQFTGADVRSYYLKPPTVYSTYSDGGAYILVPNGNQLYGLVQRFLTDSPQVELRESVKVEIRNGSSYADWDALAASRLAYAGFATSLAPADSQGYDQTLLYDFTVEQDNEQAQLLLAVLGLKDSALVASPNAESQVSYVLLLGNDYKPCFNPDGMTP